MKTLLSIAAAFALTVTAAASQAQVPDLQETPLFAADVGSGKLPPVAKRLPDQPIIVSFTAPNEAGRMGGDMRTLISRARETRLLNVIGYTRLVVYNEKYQIVPDLVEKFEVVEDRIFTFHLRKGHRWSDGQPFTAADFRYYWEDVANKDRKSVV